MIMMMILLSVPRPEGPAVPEESGGTGCLGRPVSSHTEAPEGEAHSQGGRAGGKGGLQNYRSTNPLIDKWGIRVINVLFPSLAGFSIVQFSICINSLPML